MQSHPILIVIFLISMGFAFLEYAYFQKIDKQCPLREKKRLRWNAGLRAFFWLSFSIMIPYIIVAVALLIVDTSVIGWFNLFNVIFYIVVTPFIIAYSKKLEAKNQFLLASQRLKIPFVSLLMAAVCFVFYGLSKW